MTKIYAITNQKGGVGKTTTSINLAAGLAKLRQRVLLIDLDPQGNATMGAGIDKHELAASALEVLLGEADVRRTLHLAEDGFYVLPANHDLTAAEVALMEADNGQGRLRRALGIVHDDYDYIIIDCPPSLNMLTVNALAAADGVIIPVQCEYFALEGLSALLETVEQVAGAVNPQLGIAGLLRTMYDARNNLANEVSSQLETHFSERVYRTIIPRNVRLAEAPSHGQAILRYDPQSRGALAYLALAAEVHRLSRSLPADTQTPVTVPEAAAGA